MKRWLAALTCASFAVRLSRLLENATEPCGWDGYYYVVQVERLVTEHRLHAPDGSWVLYVLGSIGALVPDPIFAVKLGASLLAALAVPAAFLLGQQLYRQSLLGAWLLAGWAAASPTLMHLSGDFPKNLGAVAPLLFAHAAAQAFAHTRDRRWLIAALAAAVVSGTAHRLGAALLLLSAVGSLLGFRAIRGLVLTAAAVALAFFVASALLPNLLNPEDLARVAPQLSVEVALNPWPYFSLRQTGWLERIELMSSWPALVVAAVYFVREPQRRPVLGSLALPLLPCVLPFWRSDVLDVGYRLSLMAPLFAVPIFLSVLPPFAPRRLWLVAIAGLALTPLARFGFDPQATPPYGVYRRLIAAIPRPLPKLLIAHRGINFLYDHETGHEAMAWAPEPELDRTQVGRIVWGITDGEWLEFPSVGPRVIRLSSNYVYLREDQWEQFVAAARAQGSLELQEHVSDPRNPGDVRPASFLRNR